MKKIICNALLCLIVLTICSCGTKKVESSSHYGYGLDFVENNFELEGYELVLKNDRAIRYKKAETTITFTLTMDEKYIDSLYIVSDSKDDAVLAVKNIDEFMDIYSDDCMGADFLESSYELGSLTDENIQFGYIPEYDGNKFMFEIIKYQNS